MHVTSRSWVLHMSCMQLHCRLVINPLAVVAVLDCLIEAWCLSRSLVG